MDSIGKMVKDRIVIGFDLADDYSLISYYTVSDPEPITVSQVPGSDDVCIPTVLGKYYAENRWVFGKEAVSFLDRREGTAITNLLSKARLGKKVEVEMREYDPVDLLALYMKKCFSLLAMSAPVEKVSAITITVDHPDSQTIGILTRAIETLRIKPEKVYFQSHSESAYQYVLNQNKDIWRNDVVICHIKPDGLYVRKMRKIQRTTPTVVLMEEHNFQKVRSTDFIDSDELTERQKDAEFLSAMQVVMDGGFVSAVYLIGDEFAGNWWQDTLAFISKNRRVFRGNNLFSKGAAYGAREKICTTEIGENYVFLGKDKVKANVGMRVMRGGEEVYMALLDAGKNWFETKREIDLILDKGEILDFIVTPLNGKNVRSTKMYLTGMPLRPARATRIHLEMTMISEKKLNVIVSDMGFGEFFESSGLYWTTEIIME